MSVAMQGQSSYTWWKQERFSPVFAQSLLISKAQSVARFPYYHVDLNAGSGYNHDVQVEGSPVNFLRAVTRTGRQNVFVFFVDHNRECIRELIRQPLIDAFPADRVAMFPYDNAEILPVVSQFVAQHERRPDKAVGSIVIDPNGYHKGVPWRALYTFCRAHPRFDLFVNLNIRSFRCERAWIDAGTKPGWQHYQVHPPSGFRDWFHRAHWMWTDITRLGGCDWVQAVGRTMQTQGRGYARLGFYDGESERARAILARIDATTDTLARTAPLLPFLQDV